MLYSSSSSQIMADDINLARSRGSVHIPAETSSQIMVDDIDLGNFLNNATRRGGGGGRFRGKKSLRSASPRSARDNTI